MKALRIIIIAFIVLTVSVFIILTTGKNPEILLFEKIENYGQNLLQLVLLLLALNLLSTLAGLPVFYFGMAYGFLLPLLPALLISWSASLLSVMATFFMVRFAFHEYFREKYGSRKMIRRVNQQIRNSGIWPVVFSRAIYIVPTNIINFSFPVSKISSGTYFFGTALGLIPEVFINVFAGYLIRHEIILLSSPERQLWKIIVIAGSLLLFTGLFIFLKKRQKRIREFKRFKDILPVED
ncbi:MAG: VTT domain-containing protein [Bacteroidales bacterium]|nr:VTT domain-containing protein [Bacteroidales bacterium]MBN2698123.1 VTT domain-containing protein [Bacteroidales bacterium]